MKRFLSILMSMALVVTLLVSMSAVSFAVDWTEDDPTKWDVTGNGDVIVSVAEMSTEEADEIAMNYCGEDFAAFASYYPTDIYLFKIRIDVKNTQTWTTKSGMQYYGQWLDLRTSCFQFDVNDMAWTDDLGEYVYGKGSADDGAEPWLSATEDAIGTFRVGREMNMATTNLKELLPMSGTLAAHTVGDGAGDYVQEIFVMTNTKTFDFNIFNNYYITCYLDEANKKAPASNAPASIAAAVHTKHCLPGGLYSVVDGELAVNEPEPETHAFVVYGEGDVELANETLEEGEAIVMPSAPAVEGKAFSHWATTKGGSEVEPATVMGTEDLTYYAVYTVNKYTITFIVDGATTTKTVEHGVIPTYDGTPSKDGYTFTGWDKEFVAATGDATYTAQFVQNAPTQYEITFVVEGVETKVMTNAGDTPVYPNGTPSKDGHKFTGWTPAIVAATANATYTAQFEEIVPAGPAVEITTVERIDTDIFPGSTLPEVEVSANGKTHTVSAARLHRVHTTFDYDASVGTLKEMGMLFVPKAVAGSMSKDEIISAGIAKDANCNKLPGDITGGTTGVVFKAGLVDVPAEYKGITIYAIPYYTLSGGTRQYHDIIETTF